MYLSARRSCVLAAAAAAVVLGCNKHPLEPLDKTIAAVGHTTTQRALNQLDILFVVDNSGSMCLARDRLREAFDAFAVDLAEEIEGTGDDRQLDVHIAVTNTDVGDKGRFVSGPADSGGLPPSCKEESLPCDGLSGGRVIKPQEKAGQAVDEAREEWTRELKCFTAVGASGDVFEQGLQAMRLALSCGGENDALFGECCNGEVYDIEKCGRGEEPEFLRPRATLMVVFVSEENDCSLRKGADLGADTGNCEWRSDQLEDLSTFRDFLLGLKAHPATQLGVAALVGPRNYSPEGVPITYIDASGDGLEDQCGDPPVGVCECADGRCEGPPLPACVSEDEKTQADAGWRYLDFAELFGDKQGIGCPLGVSRDDPECNSICDSTFDSVLARIATLSLDLGRTFCLERAPRCEIEQGAGDSRPCVAQTDAGVAGAGERDDPGNYDIQVRVCETPNSGCEPAGWDLLLGRGDCAGGAAVRLHQTAPPQAWVNVDYFADATGR